MMLSLDNACHFSNVSQDSACLAAKSPSPGSCCLVTSWHSWQSHVQASFVTLMSHSSLRLRLLSWQRSGQARLFLRIYLGIFAHLNARMIPGCFVIICLFSCFWSASGWSGGGDPGRWPDSSSVWREYAGLEIKTRGDKICRNDLHTNTGAFAKIVSECNHLTCINFGSVITCG